MCLEEINVRFLSEDEESMRNWIWKAYVEYFYGKKLNIGHIAGIVMPTRELLKFQAKMFRTL